MITKTAGMAALAGLLCVPVWAQAGSSATVPPSKVAVINLQQAVAGTAEGKQASQEIRTQFAPREAELEKLQKQIQDISQRLQTGATTLSQDEQERLRRQGNELTRRGQREQQDLQDDLNDAQQEAINRIGGKLVKVLDKYAKQNGYGVVIDSSSSNTPVIYRADQADITQQIIKLYDEAYPAKAATPGAASHTASSKPSQK